MVYLYRKRIGKKEYYYLRASVKKGGKLVTKDVAYLGNDPARIRERLDTLPQQYRKEIRRAYHTLQKFIEANRYLEKARSLKLKKDPYLAQEQLIRVEACKLHWVRGVETLDQTTKAETLRNFAVEFAFNTTAIEGNTITLQEARKLLLEERTPKERTLREVYDVQNTERVFTQLFADRPPITHQRIQEIHRELMRNIDRRTGYRTQDVRVFKARFHSTPAPYVKTDMDLLLTWLKKQKLHPLVLATTFHHKFEKIHPFMDGNGRTGRMLANLILIRNNYPPLIYRKKHRRRYLAALAKADTSDLEVLNLKAYADLLTFSATEYTENYWNLFL